MYALQRSKDNLVKQELNPMFLNHPNVQVDIESKYHCFEMKNRKGTVAWTQIVKWLDKLIENTPDKKQAVVVVKTNRQPPLMMIRELSGINRMAEFEAWFGTTWVNYSKIPKDEFDPMAMMENVR